MTRRGKVCLGRSNVGTLVGVGCAPAPSQKPRPFISGSDPVLEWFAGGRPRLIQCIPCRAANSASWIKVASLSPEREPELVKPAAILSFQPCPWVMTACELAYSKALNCAEGPPVYVGAPKMTASAKGQIAPTRLRLVGTEQLGASTFSTPHLPASACRRV